MAYRFNITDGPSKWDLILSIFDGDSSNRRKATFSIEEPEAHEKYPRLPDLDFVINGATREDGSGENWLIQGYYPGANDPTVPMNGFYSTKNRRGWLEF